MSAPLHRASIAIAAIGIAALALTGCSPSTTTPEPTASQPAGSTVDPFAPEIADPSVLLWRQTSSAPYFVADAEGLLADYGLTPVTDYAENSPAALAAVVGGTGDIASSSLWAVMSAIQEGIELKVIGEVFRHVPDSMFMETLPGSGIDGIEDLAGHKVGVPGLNAGNDLSIKNWYDENGPDWSTIEFVSLGYGEMGQALQTGAIDAGTFTGAALVQARAEIGSEPVFDFTEILDNFPALSYIVRADWAAENPNTVAAFQCAVVVGGATLAADDDDLYRESLKTGLGWDDAAVDGTTKVSYGPFDDVVVQSVVPDLMFKNDLLADEVDMNEIIVPLPDNC